MPTKDQLTDMERVSVQLTSEMKAQIYEWSREANIKPGYFMSLALSMGARSLWRQLSPEQAMMNPQVWSSFMEAAMQQPPEVLTAMFGGELDQEKLAAAMNGNVKPDA